MLNLNVNTIQSIRNNIQRGDGLIEFEAELLVIGAGGGTTDLGGGGAGGFISSSWFVPPVTTFDVVIGAPLTAGSRSESTKLVYNTSSVVAFEAVGGGISNQNDGGSGAGGYLGFGETISSTIPPRAELAAPTGSNGGRSQIEFGGAGGGGGATEAGRDRTSNVSGGQGGAGKAITETFVNGLVAGVLGFANGGDGRPQAHTGAGTAGTPNSGNGADGSESGFSALGGSGLFAIKYAGLPKASGGTITQSGGYTTHVFTGSAEFITTGKSNNNP